MFLNISFRSSVFLFSINYLSNISTYLPCFATVLVCAANEMLKFLVKCKIYYILFNIDIIVVFKEMQKAMVNFFGISYA